MPQQPLLSAPRCGSGPTPPPPGEMITKIIRKTFCPVMPRGSSQKIPQEPRKEFHWNLFWQEPLFSGKSPFFWVTAPGALTGFFGKSPENSSKIFFGGRPHLGGYLSSKNFIFPNFIVKNGLENPHKFVFFFCHGSKLFLLSFFLPFLP